MAKTGDFFMATDIGCRLVIQKEFFLVWGLKDRCPLFKVHPPHRRGTPFARRIALLSSLNQFP